MAVWDRIRSAFSRKESAVGGLMAFSRLGRPVWSAREYRSFAREGYSQNVIAYRCIRLIAENVAAISPMIYEGDNELSQHPLLGALARPNPWQSCADLIDTFTAYFLISGNAFLEAVLLDGNIREFYALRPDRMKAIAGAKGYPQAWLYSVDGGRSHRYDMEVVQPPILHLRDFNPLDDGGGMSPVEAAAFAIDIHNSAGAFNKSLLDNAATPSGALVYKPGPDDGGDGRLPDPQFKRLKAELEERHSGARNAGRPMLLEGGLSWEPMGQTARDMEFHTGKREAAREIALAFGVPPMLLGIPGDNTYSNYREANAAFHRQRIIPLAERIFAAIGNWVSPTFPGLRVAYDPDKIDALSVEREALWDRISKADFLTTDEKRAATGYKPYAPDSAPGGSILVSGTLTPLDDVGFMPGGPAPSA